MKINNKEELRMFENTLEQCDSSVLVLTDEGVQYDLKDPMEFHQGIASLISENPELYATKFSDEMKLLAYCSDVA